MKFLFFFTAFLVLTNAQGQVRKCIGPDGKVTYSDFVCDARTANETSVRTNVNNIDRSAERQEIQQRKTATELENLLQTLPTVCKFKAFINNDEKGQVLANKAQLECIKNIQAKKQGQPISQDDYQAWKDHHSMESDKRQKTLSRLSSASPKTCTPNGLGGMVCR